MNNALVAINNLFEEEKIDIKPQLREREAEVVKIITALQIIAQSNEWKVLKSLIFDGVVEAIEKKLKSESSKKPIDTDEIHRLQGQLAWAKKYADFNKLTDVYRLELNNLRGKINADAI